MDDLLLANDTGSTWAIDDRRPDEVVVLERDKHLTAVQDKVPPGPLLSL